MKVEPAVNRDDDKIVIEFGMHDAAIGPFSGDVRTGCSEHPERVSVKTGKM